MSRTFSSCSRERSWKGSVAVTRRSTSSTSHSSRAAIETRCWASTSSGFCGMTVSSIFPSRMPRATTAHSSRSPRNLGKMRPLETSPRPWPARPIRCRPRVTDFGDSTWITRSTAPMSMPSSREEVATRQGSWPDLSISSTSVRSSWEREPWWARAYLGRGIASIASPGVLGGRSSCSLPRGELVEALRQALGGAAGVDEDDRRVVFADQLQQLGVDRGPDRALVDQGLAVGGVPSALGKDGRARFGHVVDGDDDLEVELLGAAGVDDPALALWADQELGYSLERALGGGEADALERAQRLVRCSSRSRVRARCEPRLLWATAWISSTITASTVVRISRPPRRASGRGTRGS